MDKLLLWLSILTTVSVVVALVVTPWPQSSLREDVEYGYFSSLWVRMYCAGFESTMTHKTGLPRWFRKTVARSFIHRVWIAGRLHGIHATTWNEEYQLNTSRSFNWN